MLGDFGIYELIAMCFQLFASALVVRSEQARVARHLSSQHYDRTADGSHCWSLPLLWVM
jgi:hypothetical protein